jgi:glycerate kinase
MSTVDGLTLLGGAATNDALAASTRATGSVIGAVLGQGVKRVVVGLGGSASTDGGLGCVEVLSTDPRLRGIELVGACDVMVPFASALEFAEQKGASSAEQRLLAGRLERVAQIYETEFGIDVRDLPGSGAAGGLGGGLAALGGSLVPGFDLVAEELALGHRIAGAQRVVTGEGWLDRHSFEGKAVGGVLSLCAAAEVPALVVVGGADADGVARAEAQGAAVLSLVELYGPERARSHTLECIESAVTTALAP